PHRSWRRCGSVNTPRPPVAQAFQACRTAAGSPDVLRDDLQSSFVIARSPRLSSFRTPLTIALRALRRNRLQTSLTIVGMTIGVAAVLAMIAIGHRAGGGRGHQTRR